MKAYKVELRNGSWKIVTITVCKDKAEAEKLLQKRKRVFKNLF